MNLWIYGSMMTYVQAVLTNGHTAWARAQGPRIFLHFEGPPTGCGK